MNPQQLLEIRKQLKEHKPNFIRQDNPKRMKLNDKWRKPKGIHSKIRHRFKGRRKMPSPGYKSPREVKGIHFSGLKIINISSIKDINNIKKEVEGIVISKTIGMRNKLQILKKAKELNIKVLNLNIDEQIKKIEDFINSKKKKETKSSKEIKKEDTKEKEAKIEGQKSEIKEENTEKPKDAVEETETKKEIERREKDKILTKRT